MSSSKLVNKKALPSREAGQFKELLTLYETRQLKKGLKTAEGILKKFPEHGETTCMKGLILVHMGRREEGIDLVKKGVRLDLTSHICWHVLGLIHKGEKNYEEALKSYTQALRFDRENLNILRDAASLQTQLRLYDSLVETRHTLLRIRPNLRQSWVALSVAHYLNGSLKDAKDVLEAYLNTLKNVPPHDVEQSETLLYYIHLLEELGELAPALALLDSKSRSREIVDKTAISETRARLLTKLASPEATEAWHTLLERNPDCYSYYQGYLASHGLSLSSASSSLEEVQPALDILAALATEFPRASAPKRLALTLTPASAAEQFKERATAYLASALEKGIPSLFSDIKSLYVDEAKAGLIQTVAEFLLAKYKTTEPTAYLWTLYLLSQHHSHLASSSPTSSSSSEQTQKALSYINLALDHTPTLPDLLLFKGRILKRAGDLYGAARAVNEARLLDGQDRFLNTKTGKYLLRAGMVKEAGEVLGLFTKKDAPSPAADLEEMQSMLYLLEEAHAHEVNGQLNRALKKYLAVKCIYEEISDDQYDFHGYCLRKFTLTAYLRMLRWEDALRAQPAYVRAAVGGAAILIKASDDPTFVASLAPSGEDAEASKKAAKKAKKKAAQAAASKPGAAPNANASSSTEDKGLEPQAAKDEDPECLKLLGEGRERVLEVAWGFLKPLVELASASKDEGKPLFGKREVEVWCSVYDVAVRRGKVLQAVAALERARSAAAKEDGEVHVRVVDLKMRAPALEQALAEPVKSLFSEALAKLYPAPAELSLETYNSTYVQTHPGDARAALAAARALRIIGAPGVEVEGVVFGVLQYENLTVKDALAAYNFLRRDVKSGRADEFKAACDARFGSVATVFKPEVEVAGLKVGVLAAPSAESSAGGVDA